jgi:hypothetical protein
MGGQWILAVLIGVAVFVGGRQAVHWAPGNAMRGRRATVEGTWQHGVAREVVRDGPGFEANVHFTAWAGVVGLCSAVAAVFSFVPVSLGALGLAMAVFATATIEAWIRFGSGRLRDVSRVMRSWLSK